MKNDISIDIIIIIIIALIVLVLAALFVIKIYHGGNSVGNQSINFINKTFVNATNRSIPNILQ